MAASIDFTDFYILSPDNPNYVSYEMIEDEVIKVIIQKYEMMLFTNKGEVLGMPDFGADLLILLYETKVSGDSVKQSIIEQIGAYIPELLNTNFTLDVVFTQDTINYQDMMYIYLKLADYEVYAQIGKSIT
jgi:hypothetical protein